MKFRPCIDLREGKVVQIVGSTLTDKGGAGASTVTNFETSEGAEYFAALYRSDSLDGGHVIQLGPGNTDVAVAALGAYPDGLQIGGGIDPENAAVFLDAGASHVIVTSYVFRDGHFDKKALAQMVDTVGSEHLVLDLSCRWRDNDFFVVTDRWQSFTDLVVNKGTLEKLATSCAEFLVHGVDVEGKRLGIVETLVKLLGTDSPIRVTYAGGARSLQDMDLVEDLGQGRVDLTIGSALDIFGGDVPYRDVVSWHRKRNGGTD
ncbi:MAG: phosphoribosylformimino-5-aminoimidazole carboxamide ribotide isomerase [Candidatus Latescibacterota bacterium]|nr:phosphoribosylformimino-5-aminoimidazole carboxamide ribotide isomerase [Candidatus Latescibacterota bacterium]